MSKLTMNDYKNILKFYGKKIPQSKQTLQEQAQKIISTKLCRCIKKVGIKNESRSIGICTKTIINNKGYIRGKFSCKKKPKLVLTKKRRKYH